ncbi:Calx-beta domain-containing protein [Kribbella sp. NPDC056861]|uniref:Calx-beta domain-containing protein n=1 Tax=Kribbella sp. NPDC056861 TaxID=3154857 RepID=UPI003427499C
MRVFGRAGLALALLGGALLTPTGQAQAAPPEPSVAQGNKWVVEPVAGGYRVTLRLDEPAPMRDALPLIAADGVPVGVAKQSPDRRSVSLVTPDPSLLKAKDVQLVWSGDLGRSKGKQGKSLVGGATTDKEWLKAPLGAPLAVDPGAAGKYAVDTAEYNLGDQAVFLPGLGQKSEVVGKVYSPRAAVGARPLVVFLHGRHSVCYGDATEQPTVPWPCAKGEKPIPSYKGYDGAANALASNGYQVVSISANAVNAFDGGVYDQGAQARAELILDHLALWKKWSTTGGGPFGSKFVGKVDLQNVGLMGHSRGGEGVARAAVLNADRGGQYGIRAVLPLAPTDFARATVPGVAMSVILPYCDGDVSDLQGQKFYDDTRYSVTGDAAPRSTVTVLGANHNFFNTEWTPGQSVAPSNDDWYDENEQAAPCGAKYAGRLTAKEQQAVGTAYVAGFFRLQLGGETKLLPLLDGSNAHPASTGKAVVRVVSQAPEATRRDVNRLDQALPAGAVTGKAKATVCAGYTQAAKAAAKTATCLTSDGGDSPHWIESYLAPHTPTTAVTKLTWTGQGAVRINLGALQRDVRKYSALTFRATPDPTGAPKTDLTVRVIDGKGHAAAVPVSAVSDALLRMPGAAGMGLPKNLLRTVRIPTSSLKGINLRDVRAIELVTDKAATGAVFVSDLAFSTPGLGKSAPSKLTRVSATDVGKFKEGNSGTQIADFWVTLSRPSPRPVRVYAESTSDSLTVGSVFKELVFKPGQTKQKVSVPITGNTRDSYDTVFSLVLSVPHDALLGKSFGNGEVVDDDPTPILTVGNPTAAENAKTLKFPLKLSAPSDKYIWLGGQLKDGTAVIRKDYATPDDDGTSNPPDRGTYGQLQAGETTGSIDVTVVDDKVKEPTETFTLNLTEGDGTDYKLPATLTGTITDND